jgi:hypothetical protein
MIEQESWAADVPVSAPVALRPDDQKVYVDFGGFGFTLYGIAHNINEDEREELITPLYAPSDYVPGSEQQPRRFVEATRQGPHNAEVVPIQLPRAHRRPAEWDDDFYRWDDRVGLWDDTESDT